MIHISRFNRYSWRFLLCIDFEYLAQWNIYWLTFIHILTKHRLNDVYMFYVTICEISFFDSKSQYFCIMLNVLYRYSVRRIDNKSRVSAIPIEKTYTKSCLLVFSFFNKYSFLFDRRGYSSLPFVENFGKVCREGEASYSSCENVRENIGGV